MTIILISITIMTILTGLLIWMTNRNKNNGKGGISLYINKSKKMEERHSDFERLYESIIKYTAFIE